MDTAHPTPTRFRSVARVTLELTAPLSIGTGSRGDFEDDVVVTDANGLPALPGTSLAGALRAAAERIHGLEPARAWFGYIDPKRGEKPPPAQRSQISVSWGGIHDQHDRPVAPLLGPDAVAQDPVLRNARATQTRDHVRLDLFGVADERGKFDRSSVPAGHRFTFELEQWTDTEPKPGDDLEAVLALLPEVRLGGHTRSGLGTFKIVRQAVAHFDLKNTEQRAAYVARPLALAERWDSLDPATLPKLPASHAPIQRFQIRLTPTEPWVVGMTPDKDPEGWAPRPGEQRDEHQRPPDLVPYREQRIVWSQDEGRAKGRVQAEYCVPGTALKGALRHRLAFALRAQQGLWAHTESQSTPTGGGTFSPADPDGLDLVFGFANNERLKSKRDEGERGQAGRIFVSEGRVAGVGAKQRRTSMHVSLDRFTGAPMKGRLFEDEALEGGQIHFTVELRAPSDPAQRATWDAAHAALQAVFEDIEAGLFQLGAGYGRGYGWCRGTVTPQPTTGGAQ